MTLLSIKGTLAKLLATENLLVTHDPTAITASFNTSTRELTLPVLKNMTDQVYNMFVGHEVGHALWTPQNWADYLDNDIPKDFVNVIEDVRIEKMIQSKFPGLKVDFTKGYETLNNNDFFGINDKDVSKLPFIDRINLNFKLGARALVPFSDDEMVYVRAVDEADTFDKVCLVSRMISDYLNQKEQELTPDPEGEFEMDGQSDNDSNDNESTNQQSSFSQEDDEDDDSNSSSDSGEIDNEVETPNGSAPTSDEFVSQTQQNFDEKLQRSTDTHKQIAYVSVPDIKVSDMAVDIKTIRESFEHIGKVSTYVTDEYKKFIDSSRRDVSFMVQQFEMKKSADAYARASVHKTGVLNTQQLHNYKLSDDIFLRQTVTPDGKSHGMVMLLDWSGSMDNIAIPTIKQILVLTQFCRKVQIPFDVYTFTTKEYYQNPFEKAGEVCYNHINLCHVLTSSAKKSEIDTDMFNLFCQGYQQSSYCGADVPRSSYLAMGGTPLDNTLLFVPQIIREFQSKTKSQKVSFVCITDGDSAPITFLKERTRYDGKTDINMTACYYERTLIRSNRGCFDIGVSTEHTGNIAKWLTEEIPGVSVTHIFLGGLGASSSYLRRYDSRIDDKLFRKEDGICMTNKFWGVICALNPKSFLDSDSELQCEDGANKAEVKKALKKFLGKKQSSKKLLSTLVSQFA